jgi:predicted nicotinamide N-methyase
MLARVDERGFVRAHTRLGRAPLVPELALHLADGILPLWELVERHFGETGTDPPFWAFAWAGGQALARYVLDHPGEVAGRSVLDIATGGGIVALAAVRAGAGSVLAADTGRFAGAAVALNAAANGVAVDFTGDDLLARDPPPVDVVLVGDACYERGMSDRLLRWLRAAPGRVLLGDPGRAYLPADGLDLLAAYDVQAAADLEGIAVRRTAVYAVRSGRTPP